MNNNDVELIKLREVDYLVKRVSEKMAKTPDFSTNPTQNQIVFYLAYYSDKQMYQKDLCELLKLKKSSVTESLDYLEKNGVVKRIVDKDDNRKRQIVLTEEALKAINDIDGGYREINKKAFQGLSKEEIDSFNSVLTKIYKNISSII